MGQKVHPLGFRVGITKKHQSQWFARFNKYAYSQSVVEDFMLRKTLMKIFPDLLNPVVKKAQKTSSNAESAVVPKITQIQIERGLIPYEIGIQIHAENCEQIQSAIDNLKVNSELFTNLQKTRQYLSKVVSPISNTGTSSLEKSGLEVAEASTSANFEGEKTGKKRNFKQLLSRRTFSRNLTSRTRGRKKVSGRGIEGTNFSKLDTQKGLRSGRKKSKLSKADFLKIRNNKKRLKKRQTIRNRYLQLLSKGLLIRKNGNQILRKVSLKGFVKKIKAKKYQNFKLNKKASFLRSVKGLNSKLTQTNKAALTSPLINKLSSKLSKKLATLVINKVNKKFLIRLKAIMKYWHKQSQNASSANQTAQFGSNKKWTLKPFIQKLQNGLNKVSTVEPISKCYKLIDILEKKSLQKLEYLRKDFMTFGTISKTRSFGYYQLITFLKQLKEFVFKFKKQTRNLTVKNSNRFQTKFNSQALLAKTNIQNSLTQNVFNSIQQNIADGNGNESRKIKFISYLQTEIQKYRNQNIFYYLSSMAAASKDLNELKRYTKQHSNFLFGFDVSETSNAKQLASAYQEKIEKVLIQSNKKVDFDKNLQDAFLDQIENQRKMYKANLALTPKISIQFFSVKPDNLLEKASVVADSVVDALEKRKAFRGVIKKAKEDLMRRSRVKGVKIQVSGRLNGAEIARSEWVRAGRVPLQTLRANIDYSYRTASTIYGIIGVKVWIFKGYY
jgi:ribosomal protein S3